MWVDEPKGTLTLIDVIINFLTRLGPSKLTFVDCYASILWLFSVSYVWVLWAYGLTAEFE